jgi:hypothetical protein
LNSFCEPLEQRSLLAGVTILTHGFNSSAAAGSWVDRMGEAIAARAGSAAQYTLSINGTSTAPTSHTFTLDAGAPAWSSAGDLANPSGELIIKLDWGAVSSSSGISTVEVADYVANILTGSLLARSLVEVPIHLIGHSRGASLMVTLARNLGRAGLWVDQLTGLDPHPVDGVNEPPLLNFNWGDAPMEAHANVIFADSYFRPANGNIFDFAGEPIPGAANFGPLSLPGGASLNHSDVHAYYHGSIDRDATSNGDGGPIVASWYASNTARATAGLDQSRVGRGAQPLVGVGIPFGGSGQRTAVSITSPQWFTNIGFLQLLDSDGIVSIGETTAVSYRYQESHTQPATLQFSIDNNNNPYDGVEAPLGQQSLTPTGLAIATQSYSFVMPAVSDGVKFVLAKVTNADGRVRYAYVNAPLAVADGFVTVASKQFTGEIAGNLQMSEPRNFAPGGLVQNSDRVLIGGNAIAETAELQAPAAVAVMENATLRLNGVGANLRTSSLQVASNGRIDMGLAEMIVDYEIDTPAAALNARVGSAFNGGAWNGPGIGSSQVAVSPGAAVGIAHAADVFNAFPAIFGGQEIDATTVLIQRTLGGDANLDLAVNLDDFTILAARFGQTGRIFGEGDFNYSGAVDLNDFTILASQFGNVLPRPVAAGPAIQTSAHIIDTNRPRSMADEVLM